MRLNLALARDIREIGAGDVSVYSSERKQIAQQERAYLEGFKQRYGDFGSEVHELWHEFEAQETLKATGSKWSTACCHSSSMSAAKARIGWRRISAKTKSSQ